MVVAHARLKKRGLCVCGFPVVEESVPIGKVYSIDVESAEKGVLVCGGCGNHVPVTMVLAEDGDDGDFRRFVLDILELLPE